MTPLAPNGIEAFFTPNIVTYTPGAAAPEPSSLALVALGGAVLVCWGRRKRRRLA
jgi:hypothetical protein